jgi:hypothetical protein
VGPYLTRQLCALCIMPMHQCTSRLGRAPVGFGFIHWVTVSDRRNIKEKYISPPIFPISPPLFKLKMGVTMAPVSPLPSLYLTYAASPIFQTIPLVSPLDKIFVSASTNSMVSWENGASATIQVKPNPGQKLIFQALQRVAAGSKVD